MAPTRVGIIGLAAVSGAGMTGVWGVNAHLRSIQNLPDDYELVAVCNSTVESAQRSIEFHKLPAKTKAYGNPEDIAADPNVDLVVVSVEVGKHNFLTNPALQHKKSVFVEWPLAANLAEAEQVTKLAASNDVKTIVGLQTRCDPLIQKVKEILAAGKIGQVTSSTATVSTSIIPVDGWMKGVEWFLDFKSGGNDFIIYFGHFIDSFTYLLGDFTQVQGLLKSHRNTIPIIDMTTGEVVDPAYPKNTPENIFVQGELESGAVASIAFRKPKSAADDVGFRWYITGTEGEIVITVVDGTPFTGMKASDRSLKLKIGKDGKTEEIDFASNDHAQAAKVPQPGTNTGRLYENFAKGGDVVTFESALKTHQLLVRIAKSAGWDL